MATLEEQLLLHEGLRLKPYMDTVGKVTIGVGRNLTDVGLSHDEANMLLLNDIDTATKIAQRWPWFDDLDRVRAKVVVDMAFNLGPKLGLFKVFLASVEQRNWDLAADAMLHSEWAVQVPQRAKRLAAMMRTGRDYDEV